MHAEVREKSRACVQTEREREWGVREGSKSRRKWQEGGKTSEYRL